MIEHVVKVSDILLLLLLQKKSYKTQIEQMLATHVFSEFQSSHGYLRARACWCIQNFSDIHYTSEESLRFVLEQVLQCLLGEQALPIKVEAAIALQQLIKSQALGRLTINYFCTCCC